jgi:hypothetical protein
MNIVQKISLSTLGAIAAVVFSSQTAFAQQSYVLTCRGGGGMEQAVQQLRRKQELLVGFSASPVSATVRSPGPGQCAWVDRPLSENEPKALKLEARDASENMMVHCDSSGCSLFRADRDIMALHTAIKSGRIFHVRAYNNNRGVMMVTHVGP